MAHYAPPMTRGVQMRPRRKRWHSARMLLWLLLSMLVAMTVYYLWVFPVISHWGARPTEIAMTLPGDELIPKPILVTTKAVTIQATPDEVWPWLAQIGVDRGGMYSYLWVENWLLRLNVVNSKEIHPEWQSPKVGDFVRFTPVDYALNPGPGFYIMSLEPGHSLVGCFGLENQAPSCEQSATWQFVLLPDGDNATSLILRSNAAGSADWRATAAAKLAYAFQFYMERKMLITIKELAQQ